MASYLDTVQATREHTEKLFFQFIDALVSGTGKSGVIRSVKDGDNETLKHEMKNSAASIAQLICTS